MTNGNVMTITVEIKDFRCYKNTKFTFDRGITRIAGVSGKGKTTIFEAISWVLYGKPLHVAPIDNQKNAKTSVTLTIDECVIFRGKHPNRLTLTISDSIILEDDDAQSRINDMYGSYISWLCCCYLQQSTTHPIISSSQYDRFDILKELSDMNEDTFVYEEKILAKRKEYESDMELMRGEFERCRIIYETEGGKLPNFVDYLQMDIDQYEVKDIKVENKQLIAKLTQLEYIIPKLENLKRSLSDVKKTAEECICEVTDDRLMEMKMELARYRESYKKYQDYIAKDKLLTQYNKSYEELECDTVNYSKAEIDYATSEMIEYNKLLLVMKKLEVHDRNSIYDMLTMLEKELLAHFNYDQRLKYENMLSTASKMKRITEDEYMKAKTDIDKFRDILNTRDSSLSSCYILECPSCNSKLWSYQGELRIYDENKRLTQDEEKKIRKNIQECELILVAWDKLKKVDEDLHKLEYTKDYPKPTYTKSQIDENTKLLRGVKIFDEIPRDPKIMKMCKEKYDLKKKIEALGEIGVVDSVSSSTIDKLNKEIQDIENLKRNRKIADDKVRMLTDEIDKISNVEDSRAELRELIAKNEEMIDKYTKMTNMIIMAKYIKECYDRYCNSYIIYNAKIVSLSKIDKILKIHQDLSTSILQDTVDDINSKIDELSELFFDESICINLSLYKTTKTTGNVKPNVNLELTYNNNKYTNINIASGGEQARISLLLLYSFSRLSKFPMLLIDEGTAFLDSDRQTVTIECVRSIADNKYILIIQHGGIDGDFDNILDICC